MIDKDEVILPGTWLLYAFGYINRAWYVLEVDDTQALISCDEWFPAEPIHVSLQVLEEESEILGVGKFSWWRKICFWVRPVSMYD